MTPIFHRHFEESQRTTLGALRGNLAEAGAILSTSGINAEHFLSPQKEVFVAMMGMWEAGERFNFNVLANRLREMGQETTVALLQGELYESTSIHSLPSAAAALLRCQAGRQLYEIGQTLVDASFDITNDFEGILAQARADLEGINVEAKPEETSLRHFLSEAVRELEGHAASPDVVEFGLGLDAVAGPFMRGDLIVLAAETKGGKSAIAGNIVEHVAGNGGSCLIFSLEMSGIQSAERMLASQARVDIRSMKLRHRLVGRTEYTNQDETELGRLMTATKYMMDWPVDIITRKNTAAGMAAEIIRRKPMLAVVDYAQLTEGMRKNGDNREREVASVSAALKRVAVQANTVVILLSQLNEDGKLRESRALGQDANCVLFLEEQDGKRLIRVGAARSAPSGTELPLDWKPQFTKFSANDA